MRSNKVKKLDKYSGEHRFDNTHGAHTKMTTVLKQKSNNQKTYIKKPIFDDIDPYIASIEAIAAELYRFIGSIELTPKVRVITDTNADGDDDPVATISEKIEGFTEAARLNPGQIYSMLTCHKQELAALSVSAFVLEENDLHEMNWGLNDDDVPVKIDHDHALWTISAPFHGYTASKREMPKPNILIKNQNYPNALYSFKRAFSFISMRDITNLPTMVDAKPYHQLTQAHSIFFNNLREDKEFTKWKFFYFTKALLLNESILTAITEDHSINTAFDNECSHELRAHLLERIAVLKGVLIGLPEFQQFIIDDLPSLTENLMQEIKDYNRSNACDRDGHLKAYRAHRYIEPNDVLKAVHDLSNEIKCTLESEDKDQKIFATNAFELVRRIQEASHGLLYLWNRDPLLLDVNLSYLMNKQHDLITRNVKILESRTNTPYLQQPLFEMPKCSYSLMTAHISYEKFCFAHRIINTYLQKREKQGMYYGVSLFKIGISKTIKISAAKKILELLSIKNLHDLSFSKDELCAMIEPRSKLQSIVVQIFGKAFCEDAKKLLVAKDGVDDSLTDYRITKKSHTQEWDVIDLDAVGARATSTPHV